MSKGLDRYRLAIRLYANKIVPTEEIVGEALNWHWTDVAGLPMVEELLTQGYGYLNPGLREAQPWDKVNALYTAQSQQWGAAMLAHRYGEAFTDGSLRQKGGEALDEWKALLVGDARKELALGDMDGALVDDFIRKVEENSKDSL